MDEPLTIIYLFIYFNTFSLLIDAQGEEIYVFHSSNGS